MNVSPMSRAGALSFAVQVRLNRGLAPAQEVAYLRRMESWTSERSLWMEGGQTRFTIVSERELSPTDQADILIALLDDPAVREGRVGPLVGDAADQSQKTNGMVWVEAAAPDPMVKAARALYESGRLDGAGFLEALGGYVQRPSEHEGER